MAYLLQFCGLSEPLQIFYLEQSAAATPQSGPVFAGFRPFQLDDLLGWAQASCQRRGWDAEGIESTVLNVWMERAEVIRQWQWRLRQEPADRLLVAGLGTHDDWQNRCERMLQA
ncbi:hypothetical protein KQ302_05190 [Synechococcus sp. CS-602]|uniref:hypothetical protein n=1 Tax=Synechococcaceae TaxID=1890426 RepID=UPI0008FF0795|nr:MULTISPECIES: hypothetical protein [Synechococcaceae]MCT4363776.1 hypothetical protein [Candidatus Regnicoccus frigidus MAG-AL1]APD47967.1 hypothetical protein BM449_06515 [Synechococcus sp. SynAce01]MCT0201057.1 hypothetical protein [Synechococcus sp. CS-603]MCT0204506.1 hypothetical protein [Synechococcus sp. CS-602]MCT0245409.1 hypothetical protein [Synechococcus sp. CS-601]